MIIDTHIALGDDLAIRWEGNTYWGTYTQEHGVNATAEEKEAAKWSSLDNPRSFCLTKASLSKPAPPHQFYLGLRVFQSVRVPRCGLAPKPRGARVRDLGDSHHVGGGQGKTVYTDLLPIYQPAPRGRPPGAPGSHGLPSAWKDWPTWEDWSTIEACRAPPTPP